MGLKATILPVTALAQNCSIVWCDETLKGAIIDPGGDVDDILAAIDEAGITVERILITHGHVDHAGGGAELAERLSVPMEGPHEDDRFWLDTMEGQGRMFGVAGARNLTPDRWLKGGDTVRFGNVEMQVLHCPGHTPGHVVFYEPEARVAFVGDVIFQGSIGRTDFPKGDFDTLVKSIRETLFALGDDVSFVPGHGSGSTFGNERNSNPFVSDGAINTP